MTPRPGPVDPIKFVGWLWPQVVLYRQQQEVLYSLVENDETVVPAGNMLGKDFVTGLAVLYAFLTRHPCRVVTTSAKDDHLRVLWGEINKFIQSARYPLDARQGGPLILRHQELRKVVNGQRCPVSYVVGMVANPDTIAAMQGHHVANVGDRVWRTLFVADECSSVPDDYHKMATTWANRTLLIGNTWSCSNFFYRAVKGRPGTEDRGGDLPRPGGNGYYRRVIRIRAEDSPNVRYARAEEAAGLVPTGRVIVPGVKGWEEYVKNRATWDPIQQCVSLDADFYEGAEVKLFPREWLDRAERLADELEAGGKGRAHRRGQWVGIDPAEGGDSTAMVAGDRYGVVEMTTRKTPDTAAAVNEALAFLRRHGPDPEDVCIDRGGGGKWLADQLRERGWPVRTVAFGESLSVEPRRGITPFPERVDVREERYTYVNRRAQLYGDLSLLLDPGFNPDGFAIPREYHRFREQLLPIPKQYDREGRLSLPPKHKKNRDDKEVTLVDLIGYSPDEADALCLMVHARLCRPTRNVAGAV